MYKIKFLESVTMTEAGNIQAKTVENIYGDGKELQVIVDSWKTMGFKKVESIEVLKGSKLKYEDIVNAFYPEKENRELLCEKQIIDKGTNIIPLSDEEKTIKNELLKSKLLEKKPKTDKKLKDKLIEEAKNMGIKSAHLMSIDTLKNKIKEISDKDEEII